MNLRTLCRKRAFVQNFAPLESMSYTLFCTCVFSNSFRISRFRTLCQKQGGVGGTRFHLSALGKGPGNKSFGITCFADPYPLTLIESYAFEIIGGTPLFPSPAPDLLASGNGTLGIAPVVAGRDLSRPSREPLLLAVVQTCAGSKELPRLAPRTIAHATIWGPAD
jgi:hypothetical protein